MKEMPLGQNDPRLPYGHLSLEDQASLAKEAMNAVSFLFGLDKDDDYQLMRTIVSSASSTTYTDIGNVNNIILSSNFTYETEKGSNIYENMLSLTDGVVVMFSPKNINTGAATLTIMGYPSKDIVYQGVALYPGMLRPENIYLVKYNLANDNYELYNLSSGNMTETPDVTMSLNVVEGSRVLATINNFTTSTKYDITARHGVVDVNSNGTFYYTAPNTSIDFMDTITLTASKSGETVSLEKVINVNVHATAIDADILFSNSSFAENAETTTNITL